MSEEQEQLSCKDGVKHTLATPPPTSSARRVVTDALIGGGVLGAIAGLATAVVGMVLKRKNPNLYSSEVVQSFAAKAATSAASMGAFGGAGIAIASELHEADVRKQEVMDLKEQQARSDAHLKAERSFVKQLEATRTQSAEKATDGHAR